MSSALVECPLHLLEARALRQSGETRSLQILGFCSHADDGGSEDLLIPALVIIRRATTLAATTAVTGWALMRTSHENFCRGIAALALGRDLGWI